MNVRSNTRLTKITAPVMALSIIGGVFLAGCASTEEAQRYSPPNDTQVVLDSTDQETIDNARIIYDTGKSVGATDREIVTALNIAATETNFRVYASESDKASQDYPHDGLSTSPGVGMYLLVPKSDGDLNWMMNTEKSSRYIFKKIKDEVDSADPVEVASQKVQRSAFPGNYRKHLLLADEMFRKLDG